MSEDTSTTAEKESHGNEQSRPQTVSLNKLRSKNNSFDKETSIGDAFFLKEDEESDDDNDNNLRLEAQDTNSQEILDDSNHTENGSNSPKPRPKTVIKQRTDGYQQRLVDLGAIGSKKLSQEQTLSPKPKSEKCYICGKEFLLSSLKIHEKQCAKKHEKDKHENASKAKKTSSVTKDGKKPQLEACYLCGKEFFIHSLGIHETQCIKNWKANKTPDAKDKTVSERTMVEKQCNEEQLRKTVPVQKSTKKEVIKNQNASPKLEKKSDSPGQRQKGLKTMPCYICGVAFLPHSLKIHEKKCQKKGQSLDFDQMKISVVEEEEALLNLAAETLEQTSDETQAETNPENINANNSSNTYTPKKPKTIVCYICGQEFLKSSYTFHEKKCANVAENFQEKETSPEVVIKANQNSPKNSQKPRTIVCYICGQEFLKSSYAFHEKKCASKKVDESDSPHEKTLKLTTSGKENVLTDRPETPRRKPKTKTCCICGKEMLLSSLKVHEQQCQKKTDILKSINDQKSPAQKRQGGATKQTRPKTQVCYICGETFLSSSIKVHEAQCEKRWNGKT